ncbi:MAG TPA: flagellar biosynthesis anti-sigma factor FlgM [Deltaproteobacteria bacterium]|jgi:flagellar biosynthesis anti-sigma factor FlgM|nr:flagellar biosynthesis anti-sigma factor FlgM [Deltaproteobacteria bacterium]HOI08571.1 flagellar biosynthesis anti-sigma factor FlgM [Deltaproteobacteria bacterium]
MKINNGNNNVEALKAYGAAAAERPQRSSESGEKHTGAVPIQDKINISSKVKMYQDIREAAIDAPDIRLDKVNDIEQRIATGTYKPDYGVIADKLLSPNISSKI